MPRQTKDETSRFDRSRAGFQIAATVFFMVVLLALLIRCLNQFPMLIGSEPALHLQCAEILLNGGTPYVDFYDFDGPLITYLSAIPVHLARINKIDPIVVFQILTVSLTVFSLAFCSSILLRRRHHIEWHLFPPILVALTAVQAILLFDLGQREHLLMLFLTPCFLLRWLRYGDHEVGRKEAVLAGLLAGLGLCLSPFFLIAPLILETFWLIRTLKFKNLLAPEVVAAVSAIIAYCVSITLLPAQAKVNLFSLIGPVVLKSSQLINFYMFGLHSIPDRRDVLYAGVVLCSLAMSLRNRSTLVAPLTVLFLSGFLIYLVPQVGLSYTVVPMIYALALLAAVIVILLVSEFRHFSRVGKLIDRSEHSLGSWRSVNFLYIRPFSIRAFKTYYALASILIAGFLATPIAWKYLKSQDSNAALVTPQIKEPMPLVAEQTPHIASWLDFLSKPGDQIVFLAECDESAYPTILQMHRRPGSRLLTGRLLVFAQYAAEADLSGSYKKITARLCKQLEDDLKSRQPKVVFMQTGSLEEVLTQHKTLKYIDSAYDLKGQAYYYSDNRVPLEFTGYNYKLNVYLLKRQ